jgi:NADPH-dependent 7-cyano-7-deazaguanine reductase QueF-like protein
MFTKAQRQVVSCVHEWQMYVLVEINLARVDLSIRVEILGVDIWSKLQLSMLDMKGKDPFSRYFMSQR